MMTKETGKEQTQTQPAPTIIQNRWVQRVMVTVFVLAIVGCGAATVGSSPIAIVGGGISGWEGGEDTKGRLEGWVSGTEAAFDSALTHKERWIDWYGLTVRLAKQHFIRDVDYSYSVIKDNSDMLQFITYVASVPEIVQTLGTYKDIGTPIIYVQPPTKYMDDFTKFPINLYDKTAENTANLLASLEQQHIPYLDLRQRAADQLDRLSMFYRTDHHWQTETAFWAVGETVDFIRQETGLDLDPDGYYTDPANYDFTVYDQCFLGSQGRRVGRYYNGLDNFTLITPSFATSYEVQYVDEKKETCTGGFTDTIVEDSFLNMADTPYTNRYAAYFGGDHMKVVIDNQQIGREGKRILVVKDSFGLPYSAFLSTMVDQLVMVDLRYYPIDELREYMEVNQFDLVIVMYH